MPLIIVHNRLDSNSKCVFYEKYSLFYTKVAFKKWVKDNPNKGFGLLLQFMKDLSGRELVQFIQKNSVAKWFCGFSLNEITPDHTVFSRTRNLIEACLLSKIFTQLRE